MQAIQVKGCVFLEERFGDICLFEVVNCLSIFTVEGLNSRPSRIGRVRKFLMASHSSGAVSRIADMHRIFGSVH